MLIPSYLTGSQRQEKIIWSQFGYSRRINAHSAQRSRTTFEIKINRSKFLVKQTSLTGAAMVTEAKRAFKRKIINQGWTKAMGK